MWSIDGDLRSCRQLNGVRVDFEEVRVGAFLQKRYRLWESNPTN